MFQISLRRILPMLVGTIALSACQVTGSSSTDYDPYIINAPVGYENHPMFALQSDEITPLTTGQSQTLTFNGGSIIYAQARTGKFMRWSYSPYTEEDLLNSLGTQFPNAYGISPVRKNKFNRGTVVYVTFFYTENGEDGTCYKMGGYFDDYVTDGSASEAKFGNTVNALFCSTGKHLDMADYVSSFLNEFLI